MLVHRVDAVGEGGSERALLHLLEAEGEDAVGEAALDELLAHEEGGRRYPRVPTYRSPSSVTWDSDAFTRESLAIQVDTSLPGTRVAQVLDQLITERGQAPKEIMLDNGPELTSLVLDQWAYERGVRLHFIDPGKR
ncbi:MAG: transposase family protein [Chloroflexi bacterium]|nr:MAG: transposase family protein [Chloroflexota bacterium]